MMHDTYYVRNKNSTQQTIYVAAFELEPADIMC